MTYKLKTINPKIFPTDKIISCVTLKNAEIKPYGFTISGEQFDEQLIQFHRQLLADHLEIDIKNMAFQKQIHSDQIVIVHDDYKEGKSDAIITNIKGKILNISIADCCAVLIYDPINEVIAAVHSGWQGTRLNITGKVINTLKSKYKSNSKDLLVYLSPCASDEKYEVGNEFYNYFPPDVMNERDGKIFFDNISMIYSQLIQEGISFSNIEEAEICTITNKNFHSYRRDKDESGRMSALIGMI